MDARVLMPYYSSKSKAKLAECTEGIQLVFGEVIRSWDNSVLTGHRDKETQTMPEQFEGTGQIVFTTITQPAEKLPINK